MADTSVKLSGTYDSIEAYNIMVEMQNMSADYEEIRTEAAAAASAATAAVTTAQTAANSASTYAGNAQTYAGNANSSASEAAGYASDASTSATNAASSETNAHNSEVAAASSESNASTSETNAAASAAAAALAITPTGSVLAFAGSTSPTGWLLCDGSAVSRTDYAALFAVIGTTYGSGNGSTTFNLPNLTDKFIQGNSTSGTVKNAGLPNITGSATTTYSTIRENVTGALYGSTAQSSSVSTLSSPSFVNNVQGGKIAVDASKSNSIYGNSTTVQPPALTMRYIIKT